MNPVDNAEAKKSTNVSKAVAVGKDAIALLRDLALFVLAFLLLVFPSTFNNLLSSAGFEEGSFVGFKWKPKLLDSDAALKEAQAVITDLREQNGRMLTTLKEVQGKIDDPIIKEQLTKLDETNKQLTTATSKVENSVAATIASNASLVEKVQTSPETQAKWGVVYGGDTTLKDAKYEVDTIAPKLGIPNAAIYLRQGSYRAVSILDSRTEAEQVLSKAKQRRTDAYIVNFSNWCEVSNEKDGYRECVSP